MWVAQFADSKLHRTVQLATETNAFYGLTAGTLVKLMEGTECVCPFYFRQSSLFNESA